MNVFDRKVLDEMNALSELVGINILNNKKYVHPTGFRCSDIPQYVWAACFRKSSYNYVFVVSPYVGIIRIRFIGYHLSRYRMARTPCLNISTPCLMVRTANIAIIS